MATVVTTTTSPAMSLPAAGLARWTPSIPTNLISMLNPFAVATDDLQKTDRPISDSEHSNSRSAKRRPVALNHLGGDGGNSSRQSSPSRSDESVMFDEPDNRSTSEEGSVDGKERLRRSLKPKTRYSICHAPPASSTRQKLHRRPRALLQLHKLSSSARPRPAYEVIPSANFSVRLTRAITKVFTARHGLCTNDLVVLKAENYNIEDDEEEEMRDVIGLICKGRKDDDRTGGCKSRIYTASGREWEAYYTLNGAYEFFTTDEHGLGMTVRWVPKKNKDGSKGPGKDGTRKFNFSTISPSSRRHPVIASLSKSGLDINDTYRMPDAAGATPLSTPQQGGSVLSDAMEEDGETDLYETDDRLREIITLTSIWVAFKEGWSPTFRYDDKDGLLTPASPTKSFTTSIGSPPASPAQFTTEKRRSLQSISSGIIRRTSVLSKRNSSLSTATADDEDSQTHSNPPGPSRTVSISSTAPRTGRARADSSSTVLVHRAASNRRQKSQQQRKSLADLLAAHDQLQEVAREELPTRDGTDPPRTSAQPLIPPNNSDDGGSGSRSPTHALLSVEKRRESTTTTDTSGFLEPPQQRHHHQQQPRGRNKKIRKSGSWRRLLCGMDPDDRR